MIIQDKGISLSTPKKGYTDATICALCLDDVHSRGEKEVTCPTIALECLEGETQCETANEDGCYELTMGSGDCEQIIYCMTQVVEGG